jgi:hypothetical protein
MPSRLRAPTRSSSRTCSVEARVALLEARRGELDRLAKRLLEARELERVDIVSVLG